MVEGTHDVIYETKTRTRVGVEYLRKVYLSLPPLYVGGTMRRILHAVHEALLGSLRAKAASGMISTHSI